MPELPEVEITCRGISQILPCEITKIIVRESQLRWRVPKELSLLPITKIISIQRRAKYILIHTASGTLIIHLGMSGRLNIVDKYTAVKKHDHIDFILNNHKILRYTDSRRFGSVHWVKQNPLDHPLLIDLGPEPLTEEFNANYLMNALQNKKQAIKLAIMNQNIVVGVGNIYANEALFSAKINPLRPAHSLTPMECKLLVKEIKKTLYHAIEAGGTTLKDFLSPEGNFGYFALKLLVYGRENEPCVVCKNLLTSCKLGQRATVFCKHCQQ